MKRLRRSWIIPALIGLIGVSAGLILGTWQLGRMEWKAALIAEAERKLLSDPVAIPETVDPVRDKLLRVQAVGYIERRELHVIASMKRYGPGFRVITTMELAKDGERTGRRIMVDLGFVPERLKHLSDREPTSKRLQKRLPKDQVVGLLYWPDEVDGWTPPPDKDRNIWFARDVDAMAEELGAEPVLLIAQSHPDGRIPLPRPPGVDIPNRHLEYVVTWYSLAGIWFVMSLIWLRSSLRARRGGQGPET